MRRDLSFFWRQHLAVAAGAAVAAAVLTGALLVGDSVRGSLRAMTLERLGEVEAALLAEGFFPARLADRLAAQAPGLAAAPLILLEATAREPRTQAAAAHVSLVGFDPRLLTLYPGTTGFELGDEAAVLAPAILNESLARELGVAPGADLLLAFPSAAEVPRASLLGRREPDEVLETLRARVAAVVPDRGLGTFSLAAHQAPPRLAFLPLGRLAAALGKDGEANTLLLAGGAGAAGGFEAALRAVSEPRDLGLSLTVVGGALAVGTERLVFAPEVADAVLAAGRELGADGRRFSTYLVNRLAIGGREIPYSSVAALEPASRPELGQLWSPEGEPVPVPAPGTIAFSSWAAEDLAPQPGDVVELELYAVVTGEKLVTREATLTAGAVVAPRELGADPALTPEVPGLADADDMAAWDPPFPVELSRIRPRDEQYWDLWRAAPKAFVAWEDGEKLWQSRFGLVTGLRFAPPAGETPEGFGARLARLLPQRLPLAPAGLTLRPVRDEGLLAAAGATDFSGLFLAFSMFLIVAAALLVGLLFSLAVDARAKEVGLLRAIGFAEPRVRRRFLAVGLVPALGGSLAGALLGIGWAAAMVLALTTVWRPAIGASRLALFVTGSSLAIGFAAASLVILAAIALALRRLRRASPPALLAGSIAAPGPSPSGRRARWLAIASGLVAALCLLAPAFGDAAASPLAFFGAGSALLVLGLALFRLWCARGVGWTLLRRPLVGLALGGAARNPGRSLLALSLVAAASFVIVATALQRRDPGGDAAEKSSGAGGFTVVAESSAPLFQHLDEADGRFELGLSPELEDLLAESEVVALPELPGDDASCLNLYRIDRPRVLGLPAAFLARGGFEFQAVARPVDNPWLLLAEDLGRDAATGAPLVPAVADFETATWLLKKGLGDDLVYTSERGQPVHLRLVGLLHGSLFQSELLVAQERLLEHFPGAAGARSFLFAPPAAAVAELPALLERDLADFGFDARSSAAKLAGFKAVQNTYLSTFQTLGGLGLLLGTFGLGVIVARNVLERRGELAMLAAFGFTRRRLLGLVVVENVFLLVLGVWLGAGAAFVAALPVLAGAGARPPWLALGATLAAILAIGGAAAAVAASRALAARLLPALRSL